MRTALKTDESPQPLNIKVHLATALDLLRILEWLRDELVEVEHGVVSGLYCDADRITQAWRDDRLFVIRANDPARWATPALAHVDREGETGERVAFCIPVGDTKLIHVHPKWRGRGCGSALVRFMIERARECDIDRLSVETNADNAGFWKRFGFKPVEWAPPMYALSLE